MCKLKFKTFIELFIIFVALLMTTQLADAEEGSYFVRPILPESQNEEFIDYFNFNSKEELDETVTFSIVNESEEEKEFTISLLDSYTTDQIRIDYSNEHEYDKSLIYKFSELAEKPSDVTVKAKENKIVSIHLKKDFKNFKSGLFGAFNITEKKEEQKADGGVTNLFAYNIPVYINIATEKDLADILLYEGLKVLKKNGENFLKTTFRNEQSQIIRNLTYSVTIKDKENEKVYYNEAFENLQVAPNTIFHPTISLKELNLPVGDYIVNLVTSNESFEKSWEDKFSLTQKDMTGQKNNFSVKTINKSNNNWLLIIIILLIAFIICVVLYIITSRRKKVINSTTLINDEPIEQKVKRKKKRKRNLK